MKWNEKRSVALLARSSRICVWGVVEKKRRARAVRQSKTQSQKLRKVQNEWNWIFRFIFVVSLRVLRLFYHQNEKWQFNFQLIELAAAHESNSNVTRLLSASTKWCANQTKAPTTLFFLPPFSACKPSVYMWSELTVQKNVKTRIDKISSLFKRT